MSSSADTPPPPPRKRLRMTPSRRLRSPAAARRRIQQRNAALRAEKEPPKGEDSGLRKASGPSAPGNEEKDETEDKDEAEHEQKAENSGDDDGGGDDPETIERLKAELEELKAKKAVVDHHIKCLHRYNEMKDIAQMLFGKLAEIRGVRTRDIYADFDLELDD